MSKPGMVGRFQSYGIKYTVYNQQYDMGLFIRMLGKAPEWFHGLEPHRLMGQSFATLLAFSKPHVMV
jgi:hypothetical protein